jgi:DNA (cytosine-5)-methyltransferase 1
MKPRLLDLFCGAGGAAMGYHRAGFEVVGVDIKPQPRYPFEFVQADAINGLGAMVEGWRLAASEWRLEDFDAIHASPPCQRWSTATKRNGTQGEHPDLIAQTRELLKETGLPYVIENVVGAPLDHPMMLCGSKFNLSADGYRLKRHRLFELSWDRYLFQYVRDGCRCSRDSRPVMDVTGGGPTRKARTDGGGGRPYKGTADQARRIMGIDWMTKAELNEAVPPAYTEFVGTQLLAHLTATVAA